MKIERGPTPKPAPKPFPPFTVTFTSAAELAALVGSLGPTNARAAIIHFNTKQAGHEGIRTITPEECGRVTMYALFESALAHLKDNA